MPDRDGQRARQRRSSFFASCAAGLARLLREQLEQIPGLEVTGTGSDGQADYVLFDADREGRAEALRSRLAQDVFVEAGRTSRDGITDPGLLAGRCWRPDSVQRALSVWAEQVRPLSTSMTFGITARVQTGPRSLRAGLRGALAAVIRRDRPRWRAASAPQVHIWLSEWRDGQLVAGLRLGGNRPHDPAGPVEASAFVPSVAAAMVYLAGKAGGVLLDPCCGSGTILAEALAAGWTAEGTDVHPASLAKARRTAAGATVREGDATEILEPDDAVGACVSGLPPIGPGDVLEPGWLTAALAEMSRITRTGGAVVLLTTDIPRQAIPGALRLRQQLPLRAAGGRETIWVFRRA